MIFERWIGYFEKKKGKKWNNKIWNRKICNRISMVHIFQSTLKQLEYSRTLYIRNGYVQFSMLIFDSIDHTTILENLLIFWDTRGVFSLSLQANKWKLIFPFEANVFFCVCIMLLFYNVKDEQIKANFKIKAGKK